LGFHTFMAHPGIFPQIFWSVVYVALVQICI
jgi:hypothetical protein